MAIRETKLSWYSKSVLTHADDDVEIHLHVHGKSYHLRKKPLIAKSRKLSILLEENQHGHQQQQQLSYSLNDIPGNSKTFEVVIKFCYGFEPNLSSDNVIPLICLAYYLDMTEEYSPNNLLNKGLNFLQHNVLPLWNESLRALQSSQEVFQQAVHLRLVDACLDSLVEKGRLHPYLLGQPLHHNSITQNNAEVGKTYMPNARRRLFGKLVNTCKSLEDLTMLPLQLYDLVLPLMIQAGVPSEYIAGSIYRYTKKWTRLGDDDEVDGPVYQREVIETMEKLLPDEKELLPCKILSEMLQCAIALQASGTCRQSLEIRMGKQLTDANVEDLLIPPFQGYARDTKYDIDSVKRILKSFYANYASSDTCGLVTVAELTEEFLAKVASDVDLKKDTFIQLAEMAITTSTGIKRNLDRVYRAIDIYLDKHSYLTESEREDVCQVLDCHKLSSEACTHVAQNDRLPVRVVVQALFVGQLHLREAIVGSSIVGADTRLVALKEENTTTTTGIDSEEMRMEEMDKMESRVIGLEKECCEMKKQIVKSGVKGKGSMWKGLKRKFGCISGMNDCNCHVKKKVHPIPRSSV